MTDADRGADRDEDTLFDDLMRAKTADLRSGAAEVDRTSADERAIRRRRQWDDYSLGKHIHRIKVSALWIGAAIFCILAVLVAAVFIWLAGHHVLVTVLSDPEATARLLADLIHSVLLVLATLFVQSLWKRMG